MAQYRPDGGRDDGVDAYDYDDPRRYTSRQRRRQGQPEARNGGAVVSRRSRLGDALRGIGRGEGRRSQDQGQAASQQAYYPRQQTYGQQGYPQQYGYSEQPVYQEGPKRRPHRARNVLLVILAILVGLYLLICVPIDRSIAFSDDVATSLSGELSMHVPLTPYYVLALGSDAREGDTVSRTDTMILCRIDPLAAKVTMVSIPRDTMVQIDGHGTQKINAAYAFGGAAGAVKAVKNLTGASVNHVALVNFDGIETLVNALGGVTVDVPVDVNDPGYTGLVLSAGTHEMDGHTAMLFSRIRHGFANGDYQRQEDQRILISAIMKKALSNPLSLPAVGKAMGGLLSTTMRCYNIIPLLTRFAIGGPTIYSASIPSSPQTIGGVSYVVADEQATATMMQVVNQGGDPSTVANGVQ